MLSAILPALVLAFAQPAAGGEPVVIGQTFAVPSEAFGQVRLTVRTPNGYGAEENADRRYPVLYLIDGGPEQDFPHVAGLAQLADTNPVYGEFVLVGVETEDRRARITPFATDPAIAEGLGAKPGGSADFRAFLSEEAMPWVDARYRTSGRDAVLGESLAGLFVVETFLAQPDLFDDYVASSPSMWWDAMTFGRQAPDLLSEHGASDRTLAIYMADEGEWMEEGTLMLVDALEASAPEGLRWTFHDLSGQETHASIFHTVAFDAIRSLYPQPVRLWRSDPTISGEPLTPRTPEMEAKAVTECTTQNARAATPEETKGPGGDRSALYYECFLYDWGHTPDRGNWDGLSR